MPANVVPARPFAARRPARDGGDDVFAADGVAQLDLGVDLGALAPREQEAPVDEGGAEAPLRDQDPPHRHQTPADQGVRPSLGRGGGRVGEEEAEEGQRDPGPAALDEEDVEDVALAGKVRGRKGRVLGVGVDEGIVGGVADGRGEEGEEGAKGEHDGVGQQEGRFERRREEGPVSCVRGGGGRGHCRRRRRRRRCCRRGRCPFCSGSRVGGWRRGVHLGG